MKIINVLLCCVLMMLACHKPANTIQEGDILFQDLNCGDLCDAIETVTQGVDGKHFSHCSLVVKDNDSLKVVEAIGGNVQINSLYNFFKRSGDTNAIKNITVARVKEDFKSLLPAAENFAKKQVNAAYDDEFILNNGKWYCSELLYEAFKQANKNKEFFGLEPMTFKDPKTHDFFPAWVQYYQNLHVAIPEGKLGINPGLMSRSPSIELIKIDKFQQQ